MVALITGASGAIGKEIAVRLAQKGYKLALGYHRHREQAVRLAEELGERFGVWAVAIKLDLQDPHLLQAQIEDLSRTMGRIGVLVNNAAVSLVKPLEETSIEEWNEVISVNLTGAFVACKAVLPAMREGGVIVNVSSMWGSLGASCEAAYAASKGGLEALSRSLAKEYPQVKINVASLGWVDTPMNARFSPKERADFFVQNPAMYPLTPADAADVVIEAMERDGSGATLQKGW